MLFLLQSKNIIFKDKIGQIKCVDFENTFQFKSSTTDFAQKKSYQITVSSIYDFIKKNGQGKEPNTLILNSQLFGCPGLINALKDNIGKETTIQSDLEFAISSQNLKSGKYSIINITENESYLYNFVIDCNNYILLNKIKLDNNKLKRVLANKFTSTQSEAIFSALFNYSNVIEVNQFIENNEITEEEFSRYTLSDISLGGFLNIDFKNFFEKLCSSIQYFIMEYTSNENLILFKSALTGFQPVKSILSQNKKVIVINELDLLRSTNPVSFLKYEINSDRYELNCHPTNKKGVFPFSTWILSETENLSIELFKFSGNDKETFQINLKDLKENLSNTAFSINNKQLVKYFVEFDMDICNNIYIKINTLDKHEFYFLINK